MREDKEYLCYITSLHEMKVSLEWRVTHHILLFIIIIIIIFADEDIFLSFFADNIIVRSCYFLAA